MSVFTDFLASPDQVQRYGNWLAELYPLDPDGDPVVMPGSVATGIRVASRLLGYKTRPTDTPASELYRPDLAAPNGGSGGIELEASIWGNSIGQDQSPTPSPFDRGFTIGGGSVPSRAEIHISNQDGRYDDYRPSNGYLWDGQECILKFGRGSGRVDSSFMSIDDFRSFYFVMGEPLFSMGQIILPLYGLDRKFDHPLTKLFYRGTGYCLDFAAAAYADAGAPAKLNITGNLTVSLWANFDNFTNARQVVGWGLGAIQPYILFMTATNGRFSVRYTHTGGSVVTHTIANNLSTGRWYHLTVRFSGTAVKMFIYDSTTGVEIVEEFVSPVSTRDSATATNFQLSRNSATQSMVGRLDDVRVWNEARTDSQIRSGRVGEVEIIPTTLQGYYKLNDAAGLTATDSGTGVAANGALNGTCTWMHSLEGDAPLAGKSKPDRWGSTEYFEPITVDPSTNTYQVAGGGPVQSITAHEGINAITSGGADITNEKTFIATAPASATYRTHLAKGLIKLGTVPTLPFTCKVEGYNTGGYKTKGGEIVRNVAVNRAGVADPSEINTTSFSDYDTAFPALHGIAINDNISIREVVDRVVGPGSFWGYPFDSQLLTISQWTGPAVSADLVIQSSRIKEPPEPLGNALRAWRLSLGYGLMRPHSEDEISGVIKVGGASPNPLLHQRARNEDGWSLAIDEDSGLLTSHLHAVDHRFNSQLQYPVAASSLSNPAGRGEAAKEAARLRALYSSDWEAYKFVVDAIGLQLNLNDTVAPIVQAQDGSYRLGFDGTRMMNVVAIRVNLEWNVELILVG